MYHVMKSQYLPWSFPINYEPITVKSFENFYKALECLEANSTQMESEEPYSETTYYYYILNDNNNKIYNGRKAIHKFKLIS